MAVVIPPANTPARKAMLSQGADFYLGVDIWEHPSAGLAVGKMLVQFDYRDADAIYMANAVASNYFTDADTLLKCVNGDFSVHAQQLAQALQVAPHRALDSGTHLYSQHVAIYELVRELKAELVATNQQAEFGHGQTRNNIHLGAGVGAQYYLDIPREELRTGPQASLQLVLVLPCTGRAHMLSWLTKLENDWLNNNQIKEAIPQLFEAQVNHLLSGTPEQRQHGREIAELYTLNQRIRAGSVGWRRKL